MSRKIVDECKSVKDPCKICLQTVTNRNGIKCQGACESWVHFACLNYTPGKIKDIKAGLITVTCPCPDCKTTVPKEYLTNEPYSCNNTQCPANNPPSCEKFDCQANEMTRCMPARCPPPGTLRSCAEDVCREYSNTDTSYPDPNDPCMQGYTLKTYCGDDTASTNSKCRSKDTTNVNKCRPQESNGSKCRAKTQAAPLPCGEEDMTQEVMHQMCKTVGDLAEQLNFLLDNMKGSGKNC